ncbi:unnamed protein product [Spirodela intermedia]|uniref:Uncharacterized protein n=1 Tax=Spirodela intermedia TaxID=51605 RepID=A0A7I8JE65_SPIIN|nr:unnamed protein product [Spirodela intermedia]CAA6668426.1 unnamed protein product [Spirodela intermedia]
MGNPPPPTATVNGFCSDLVHGLDELERRLAGDGAVSLVFLRRVVYFLRSSHRKMTHLVQNLRLPAGGRWLSEYMDESACLWEACSAAKLAVAAAARAIAGCRREAAALEQENTPAVVAMVQPISFWFDDRTQMESSSYSKLSNGFNGLRGALLAMRLVGALLLKVLLWGLAAWWPESSSSCSGDQAARWGRSELAAAAERLKERVAAAVAEEGGGGGVGGVPAEEFRRARAAMEEIEGVLVSLSAAAEAVAGELDDLFDDMVEARKTILNLCCRR